MKIWAHRGCSQNYPENTITAFKKALALKELTGIELDIQLTRDGELVVIHDERVDRTTDGVGFVRDYTYDGIRSLAIACNERVPSIKEVLELVAERVKEDKEFKLNIELKNSIYPYPGMEEKIVELVHGMKLQGNIVYSTFYAKSLERIYNIDRNAELGILDAKASDCLYKIKGGCKATALHPHWRAIDLNKEELEAYTVRAWMSGHLYPEKPTGTRLDLMPLEDMGITDIIMNEPEKYVE